MTLEEFTVQYSHKKVDYDGAFGAQCVDLFRQYCKDVLNVKQYPPVEGAKDLAYSYGDLKFIPTSEVENCERGDIAIFDKTNSNPYGHVAIVMQDMCDGAFLLFEQDGFAQDGAKMRARKKDNLLGILRKI